MTTLHAKPFNGLWIAVVQLTLREWRRLLIEPSRVVGILLQPLLFLLVFGVGFHASFRLDGATVHYADFFFPGVLGLVVLFSSIYATLTLVEDKKCGFFRLALVGPGGVLGAVLGKCCATFTIGFAQSCLFLPLALVLDITLTLSMLMTSVALLALASLVFAVIGVSFAWLCPSASAFHALMSVILIPMWLLSGAMFPLEGRVLSILAAVNPMAYVVSGLRVILLDLPGSFWVNTAGLGASLVVSVVLLIVAVSRRPIE